MKIFGKPLSEYIHFERYYLLLILVVGLARLGLSLAKVPNSVDRFLSMTVLELIGWLLFSVIVYTERIRELFAALSGAPAPSARVPGDRYHRDRNFDFYE
ncbi:MAG TPA: hypothetical protein VI756_22805 [Blastocatellia bacterium]